jgi:hypothetical protein
MLVSQRIKKSVCVRDNVHTNILSLNASDKRLLLHSIDKIKGTNIFTLHKVLDYYLRINIEGKVVIYGAILKSNFMAIVKVAKRRLHLLSVICKERLLRSIRSVACTLLNDAYFEQSTTVRVFAGLNENNEIVWEWESRGSHSHEIHWRYGEILRLFVAPPPAERDKIFAQSR